MNIEDKAYFAVSPAETEKKIRDLTAAWRKLMNVADNLHGMANPSPEIMKRQDQVDADMERIGEQIAKLKKSIGVQENVSVRLAKPVEDKAYFDRRIYHSTGTFHTLLDKETRVPIDGTSKWVAVDPAQYITPKRVRISGIKGEIEIAAQLSGDEIKGISAKAVKATAARRGSKARFAFVSPKYEREDSWLAKITDKAERAYTTIAQLRERLSSLQNMLQRTPPGTARTELEAYYKTQIQAMLNAKKEYEQSIKHSRTETKTKFAKEYILWALPKGETDRLHERPIAERLYTPAQIDEVKRKATAAGWHSFRVVEEMSFEDMTNVWKGKPVKRRSSRRGSKAKFEKEWADSGFSASFFIKKLQGMMAVYQGENDNEYRNKIIGYAKTLANHPDFVFNGVSSQALAKKAFALVKFKYARTGAKAKFYLDPSNIPLILKQEENENRKVLQLVKQKQASGKKSDLMDATGLAHGMAYSNATANTIQDLRKISKSKNPADKQAAQQALSKIEAIESFWQAKHNELQNQYRAAHSRTGTKSKFAIKATYDPKTKILKMDGQDYYLEPKNYNKVMNVINQVRKAKHPNVQIIYARNTLLDDGTISFVDTNFSKSKFATRGAFAEASSSPVLGNLLQKKVMPEGGWRAVETDGAALVIAFEDNDIAGNFARRAAENGYSATAPMAMAGRYWNVKVQNENKN